MEIAEWIKWADQGLSVFLVVIVIAFGWKGAKWAAPQIEAIVRAHLAFLSKLDATLERMGTVLEEVSRKLDR